jgi:hypothetical protein
VIRLHIDRIVFSDGLAIQAYSGAGIRIGVTAELTALLRNGGLQKLRGAAAHARAVRGDNLVLADHHDSMSVGRGIARAIYGGMTRVGRP